MDLKTFTCACFIFFLHNNFVRALSIPNGNLSLELEVTDHGASLVVKQDDVEKFSGWIGNDYNLTASNDCDGNDNCLIRGGDVNLVINVVDSGFRLFWVSDNTERVIQDCFDLHPGEMYWYGGPEQHDAYWPIETMKINDLAYVSSQVSSAAIAERYWLNSKGAYIFIDDKTPLFVDQNNIKQDSVCFTAAVKKPYAQRSLVSLNYTIIVKNDPKEAHLNAIEQFLGRPSGHPNERIISNPIWTTWAKFKKDINDEKVVGFAKDIADHGFVGQIEIDDNWETCYGSLLFDNDSFANILDTVNEIHDLGFTVTLWTHPFVNTDCDEAQTVIDNNYYLESFTGKNTSSWWNGVAYHIDFTREEPREWHINRLRNIMQTYGIDGFKFDAGETDYAVEQPILNGDIQDSPNHLTAEYVKAASQLGDLLEVRAGWRTQSLSILVRMKDKDSHWGANNGLHSIILILLQMNMNGYPYVLPDMIGGNGYSGDPTAELLARWTQVNTFMPTMQFSYLPWEITSDDFDGVAIIRKFVELHKDYSADIIKAMTNSIENGYPVNPPIWWVDPTNDDALKCNDQFLLGDNILIAPVIESGAVSRDVVIPSGTWKDGNSDQVYEGPQIIKDYPAPIDVLPYFIKQ